MIIQNQLQKGEKQDEVGVVCGKEKSEQPHLYETTIARKRKLNSSQLIVEQKSGYQTIKVQQNIGELKLLSRYGKTTNTSDRNPFSTHCVDSRSFGDWKHMSIGTT